MRDDVVDVGALKTRVDHARFAEHREGHRTNRLEPEPLLPLPFTTWRTRPGGDATEKKFAGLDPTRAGCIGNPSQSSCRPPARTPPYSTSNRPNSDHPGPFRSWRTSYRPERTVPSFGSTLMASFSVGVGVEEEAVHHLVVRLRAVADRRLRVRVVGVERRVVEVGHALQARPLRQQLLARLPAIGDLPREVVVRDDEQRFGLSPSGRWAVKVMSLPRRCMWANRPTPMTSRSSTPAGRDLVRRRPGGMANRRVDELHVPQLLLHRLAREAQPDRHLGTSPACRSRRSGSASPARSPWDQERDAVVEVHRLAAGDVAGDEVRPR